MRATHILQQSQGDEVLQKRVAHNRQRIDVSETGMTAPNIGASVAKRRVARYIDLNLLLCYHALSGRHSDRSTLR